LFVIAAGVIVVQIKNDESKHDPPEHGKKVVLDFKTNLFA